MRGRAVLDTCVLYPSVLRDVLLRCAENGLFEPRWSPSILDELVGALAGNRPDIPIERLRRLCSLMNEAFPEASVALGPHFVPSLPDANDEHVLRAVVVGSADVLVTLNVRHFPPQTIAEVSTARVVTPDEFLLGLLACDEEAVLCAVRCAAADMHRPPVSLGQLLTMLTSSVPRFADACRRLM